jgi:hypothetical protein
MVGVPVIAPVAPLRVNPGGSAAPVEVKVPGVVATVLTMGNTYVAPTVVVSPVVGAVTEGNVTAGAATVIANGALGTATPPVGVKVSTIPA